jgi:hypothetical protein
LKRVIKKILPDYYYESFSKFSYRKNKKLTVQNLEFLFTPLNKYGSNQSATNEQLINFWKNKIVKSSKSICDHNFSFLGINNKFFGKKINWNQDIKTGHHWDKKYYASFTSNELMPGNGIDIKIPWELSRFHHLVTIAQAWDLTNDINYSNEFFSQWSNWEDSNPFCYGINWTNTMEVAIRATNLITCLGLLKDSIGYDKNYKSIIKSVRKHGL